MPNTTTITVPLQIEDDLQALAFPPHEVTNRAPEVSIAAYVTADESIVVLSRTRDDQAAAEWVSMGAAGRDERYIVDVYVTTQVKGRTYREMMERLSDLQEVVLSCYTDDNSQFVPPGGLELVGDDLKNPLGIWTGMVSVEEVDQFAVADEGWGGQSRIAIRIAARI